MSKNTNKQPAETLAERLQRMADTEEERLKAEADPKLRQTIARTIAMLLAEQRKAEAAAAKGADELDEARVLEWFLRLDTTKQGRFLRELQQRSKKGSGLA